MSGGYPCCCTQFQPGSAGSSNAACGCCGDGGPLQYQIDVSGIVGGASCATCANVNGIYVLNYATTNVFLCQSVGVAANVCNWYYQATESDCDDVCGILLTVQCVGSDFDVTIWMGGGFRGVGQPGLWGLSGSLVFPWDHNCRFVDLVVPLFNHPQPYCYPDVGATAIVNAL